MQLAWKTIEANNDILIDKSAGEVLGSEDYTRKFIIFTLHAVWWRALYALNGIGSTCKFS